MPLRALSLTASALLLMLGLMMLGGCAAQRLTLADLVAARNITADRMDDNTRLRRDLERFSYGLQPAEIFK